MKKLFSFGFFIGIKKFVVHHKVASIVVGAIVIFGVYKIYGSLVSTTGETRYVTEVVAKQTLVVSVSGSGQVSVSDQINVKPKVSGEIVYVGVKKGQEVKIGALLAKIDTYDAEKTVSDAVITLEQEKLTLEKMKGLTNIDGTIRGDRQKALDNLQKSYEDGFNTVANVFLDLPTIMAGLQDILYSSSFGSVSQWNIDYYFNSIQNVTGKTDLEALRFRNSADIAYQAARVLYDKNFSDYKTASRFSSNQAIEQLIGQTYETTRLVAEATKDASNFLQYYKDKLIENNARPSTLADTHLSQINSYTSKTNSYLMSLLSLETNIQNSKEAIVNVGFSISDQEIKIKKAERTLIDAKQKLSECYVYAPFSGIIASVDVKKGDSVSSGSSIATLITKQRIAELSLNEIDAAKVKQGAKTTLTFDAVTDLSIAGEVSDVNTLGTVSQGVVSYAVQIVFDTQDNRVKPGMSVSAAIITDVKQNVLTVSNSAVKTTNNSSYVDVFDTIPTGVGTSGFVSAVAPRIQTVEVGISDDASTEIISGLTEGQNVVVRTISGTQTVTQTSTSASRLLGGGGGGGGIPH